jgi:hypothetical protein
MAFGITFGISNIIDDQSPDQGKRNKHILNELHKTSLSAEEIKAITQEQKEEIT